MKSLVIIGDGGHSKVVREIAQRMGCYELIAVLDEKYTEKNKIGDIEQNSIEQVLTYNKDQTEFFCAIGDIFVRRQLMECYKNLRWAILIDPSAIVSKQTAIFPGTLIGANVVINSAAVIHSGCILNTAAVIEHDCIISAFCNISPRAILCGDVTVGSGSLIGAGAVVNPGITIGMDVLVGSGSVVVKNVSNNQTVMGVPAR
ncbi:MULTISPECIES: NeuD/PglB/VioB family sugar acetyltransferase [unclassified Enterococcus]|uniref:NeuD/PglB/VioB family sugar acetyltransferase n=1 Tax=unclassified Enterococcus TaxID=2608891 RepID=UPI001CE1C4DE|nr:MULTISPECIES: NeuD/PglB/VioB family sugar acetyltransferase [unclassified Enterococcus]MCA5014443.1 NeuD/PglB/VioB family sugar acetyltransferase [Enterococcus sp. S23]MCA5017443.1 NeuD/PglB/VioB family sugar acetyltransferase [Enterococcus sp. S22(2020)]